MLRPLSRLHCAQVVLAPQLLNGAPLNKAYVMMPVTMATGGKQLADLLRQS